MLILKSKTFTMILLLHLKILSQVLCNDIYIERKKFKRVTIVQVFFSLVIFHNCLELLLKKMDLFYRQHIFTLKFWQYHSLIKISWYQI